MKIKKLFRVTLSDGKNDRIDRLWSVSENELISDLKRRLPFLIIKRVEEVKKVFLWRLVK